MKSINDIILESQYKKYTLKEYLLQNGNIDDIDLDSTSETAEYVAKNIVDVYEESGPEIAAENLSQLDLSSLCMTLSFIKNNNVQMLKEIIVNLCFPEDGYKATKNFDSYVSSFIK